MSPYLANGSILQKLQERTPIHGRSLPLPQSQANSELWKQARHLLILLHGALASAFNYFWFTSSSLVQSETVTYVPISGGASLAAAECQVFPSNWPAQASFLHPFSWNALSSKADWLAGHWALAPRSFTSTAAQAASAESNKASEVPSSCVFSVFEGCFCEACEVFNASGWVLLGLHRDKRPR
jgi:hypothetical protein